jgi:hypothetical protein
MSEPQQSVRQFVTNSYQIVSAATPTVPLHGSDLSLGILVLNQLLNQYAANGLMITVSKQVDFTLSIGENEVTFGEPDYVPTPTITTEGRLVNLLNAWVTLQGVTYPLIDESRTEFYSSYKYDPLIGLPRYVIVIPQTNLTTLRVFPGPSQPYLLSVYGKFQLSELTSNDDMSELPSYYYLYLQFALAKYLAIYKARSEAWTPKLEDMLTSLRQDMEAASSVNLDININTESWLNGAWRVRAGI